MSLSAVLSRAADCRAAGPEFPSGTIAPGRARGVAACFIGHARSIAFVMQLSNVCGSLTSGNESTILETAFDLELVQESASFGGAMVTQDTSAPRAGP
jgi:hypothetical protein